MKYTTAAVYITALAFSTALAASTSSSSSSIIKCKEWEGHCRIGTVPDRKERDTRCKDRSSSTMACVDLCCKPLVAPTPSAKPSSIIKCRDWDGHCRIGTKYDRSERNTRCKDRNTSSMSCVDECCKPIVAPSPSAKPSSIIKCKDWDGHCRIGTKYDRSERNTRCKDRNTSSMSCVDECCKPIVAPSPSAKPSSIIKCKDWEGHCRIGTDYSNKERNTRCKDRTNSSMACVDDCCKPLVAPTPTPQPSIIKCKEWTGKCRSGNVYDTAARDTRCKDRKTSSMACVDECCKRR